MAIIKVAYISCWKGKDGWTCGVFSEKSKKNLGRYHSKDRKKAYNKAKKRLKAVEFFKRQEKILNIKKIAQLDRKLEAAWAVKTPRVKKFTKGLGKSLVETRRSEYKIAPEIMAESLFHIIRFLLTKVPDEKLIKRRARIRNKIMQLNANSLSTTNLPEAASIGQALTIIKNMLFGKSATYVNIVLRRLLEKLA